MVKSGDAFGVNTSDTWSRAYFRNNLFFGSAGAVYNGYDTGPGRVMYLPSADATCHFDYDGYGSIGTGTFDGNVGGTTFGSLAEMQAMTTEANAIQADLSVFQDTIAVPTDPLTTFTPPVLALAAGAAAVDEGEVLPNVNDGFADVAPDLGAYELGQPIPQYGPGGTLGTGGAGSGGAGAGGASAGAGAGSGESSGASGADAGGDGAGCGCKLAARARPSLSGAAVLALLVALAARRRRVADDATELALKS